MSILLNNINNDFFIPIQKNDKININISIKNGGESFIFINAIKYYIFNNLTTTILLKQEMIKDGVAHICFNNKETNEMDFTFTIEKSIGGNSVYTYKGSFIPNYIKTNNKYGKIINDDNSSFMLLRTNPKLTGNIKLIVDSKNNLYIDTFNINEILSNAKYKHNLVSGKSHYCNDVRNIFKDLPKSELYKVSEENYDIFSPKNKLYNQYVDTYFYGVKNNIDKLYSENFSILAPLYIKDTLPDFFLIFKMDGATNKDVYKLSPTDRIKYFIENGKLIKSFDLRKNSPIGNYIRNIKEDFENFPNYGYLSLNDYTHNEWSGISIDKGIVGTVYESSYLLSQVKNQVDYDRYLTNAYERNGLLDTHIINFEFLFNDEYSENFTINRYFGLYVCNNMFDTIYNIDGILYDKSFNQYNIPEYCISNKRIFNITTEKVDSFQRFYDISTAIKHIKNQKNTPYQNILTTYASFNKDESDYFLSLNINKPLKSGEHLRIIDKLKQKVYEVIFSNVDKEKYNNINDFFDNENNNTINYHNDITIFRNITAGYNNISDNIIFNSDNEKEIIKKQIQQVVKSFKTILPNNISIIFDDNNIFFYSNNLLTFERISSDIIYSTISLNNKEVTYFNENINSLTLDILEYKYDTIYYPLGIPTFGNRNCYIIDFVKINRENSIYNIPLVENINITKSILLLKDNNGYISTNRFKIFYHSNEGIKTIYKSIISYSPKTNLIELNTKNKSLDTINLYLPLSFELNISGLLPIKDFNFNVLDKKSVIYSKDTFMKIKGYDVYDSSKNIDGSIIVNPIRENGSCENILNYINLYENDNNEEYFLSEKNYNEKINSIYNYPLRKMNISLVTPTNCKWVIKGKDYLNNKIKSTIFNDEKTNSYYLNIDNNTNLFGFPYDENKKDNDFYILNDISFVDKELNCSLRDKILYHNGLIDEIINDGNKYSFVYWNKNSNSLETIIFGQKIKINSDKIDLSFFNNSLFSIVCSPSINLETTPIEIIFDKKNKKILCIWYYGNGNATLEGKVNNINKRFSNDIKFIKSDSIANLKNIYNNKYVPLFFNNQNLKNKNVFVSALSLDKNYSDNNKNLTYYFKNDYSNEYIISNSLFNYIESNDYNIYYDTSYIKDTNNIGNIYILSNTEEELKNIKDNYNFNSFKNIVTNCDIVYHIIDENNTNKFNNGLSFEFINPVNINDTFTLFKNSKNKYFYNGYIEPDFINMFIFENNEEDNIKNNLNINLLNSNTNIKKVNNINQLWFNKVTDDYNYSQLDSSSNALLSFDFINEFDITKNCWDDNFYIKYKKNEKVKYINGYESEKDVKTFFGSHAMVIKNDSITIENWKGFYKIEKDTKRSFNYFDDSIGRNILILNITNALLSFFSNNNKIKSNWLFKSNASSFANAYIKNLIENIYDINNKNNINIYRRKKTSDNIFVNYQKDNDFEEVKNIEVYLKKNNNDYLLYIELPIDNYEYSVKYTLKK